MEWRIGVHLGDVLVEGDDILGDGVNIAARLEGIAEPGGICISEDAFRQVRGPPSWRFRHPSRARGRASWLEVQEIERAHKLDHGGQQCASISTGSHSNDDKT